MIEIKKGTTRISSNSKSNGRKQVYDGKSWRPCCSTEGCTNRTENNKCKKCSNPSLIVYSPSDKIKSRKISNCFSALPST